MSDVAPTPLRVSVVIPCYRSEKTIGKVVRMTREVLVDLGYDYEFVLVNDGSSDQTFARIRELAEEDPRVKGIDLVRNFGQHGAIMAGLSQTTGQLVLLMDDDLQTHPSQIPLLLDKIYEGYDVVFADYGHSGMKESLMRRLGSRFAEWTSRVLTGQPKDIYASSFFVMRDYVRDNMLSYTGPYPYIEGLVFRVTRSVTSVPVRHFEREVGSSGYTLRALVRLWSSILGMSLGPLRLAGLVGCVVSLAGLVWAIVIVIQRVVGIVTQDGWSSIMATMLVLFGLTLMFLGLIGEYLGRLSLSISGHPQFEIRTALNCPDGVDQDSRFVKPTPRRATGADGEAMGPADDGAPAASGDAARGTRP
ncbi:MAG: glycosyltransferase family 2 protein [Coriobacteriales bacterium]|jgi:glycosyltransferase involved in cell wall biosynthesis